MKSNEPALSGLTVLDLSEGYAGGYCTKILRDLGASVIKVEIPKRGDVCRSYGPFLNDDPNLETSAPFLYLNAGKKSITLDVTDSRAGDIIRRLAQRSDIIVESNQPGFMSELGLSYEVLSGSNKGLIMASLTHFGQSGPYRNYKGSDLTSYAQSGYMYLTGDEEKMPLKAGGRQAEYQGGLAGALSVVSCLIGRLFSGQGQHIDVSATEALTSTFDGVGYFRTYENTGVEPLRAGTRLIAREPSAAYPSTLLPCKDGWVHVHYSPSNPEGLAFLAGDERLADDEVLGAMRAHADEIDELLTRWLMEHTREEVQTLAQEVRVPFTMVQTVEETMNDPQNEHRKFFVDIDHPIAGTLKYPTSPFRLKTSEWATVSPPLLGQHNDEIYSDMLGFSKRELSVLTHDEVI